MSASTAFSIPELLELILCFIDWKTALLSQRVSRKWQHVISQSTILQSKLGIRASDVRESWSLQRNALNMISSVRRCSFSMNSADNVVVTKARPTALIHSFATSQMASMWSHDFSMSQRFHWHDIPKRLLDDNPAASWKRMQVTQPPTYHIIASTIAIYRDALMYRLVPGHRLPTEIRDDAGITIGQIIAIAKQWKAEAPPDVDWSSEVFSFSTVKMVDINRLCSLLGRAPE